jgi:hypothetical protein
MTLIKADEDSDTGNSPIEAHRRHASYRKQLHRTGPRLAAKGRHASAKGAHVERKWGVTDGPFAETKELFAG